MVSESLVLEGAGTVFISPIGFWYVSGSLPSFLFQFWFENVTVGSRSGKVEKTGHFLPKPVFVLIYS